MRDSESEIQEAVEDFVSVSMVIVVKATRRTLARGSMPGGMNEACMQYLSRMQFVGCVNVDESACK